MRAAIVAVLVLFMSACSDVQNCLQCEKLGATDIELCEGPYLKRNELDAFKAQFTSSGYSCVYSQP